MCQTRELDLDEFFKHENQGSPPAISVDGELYTGNKSDLVTILKEYCEIESLDAQPYTDFLMIDGSIFVHTNPPKTETISEYSKTFVKKISDTTEKHMRVDVVFYQYSNESIKLQTRKNRGNGVKCKVVLNGKIPKNWKGFLRNLGNKEELFQLANSISNVEKGLFYVTLGNSIVCNRIQRKPICCNHEEGDKKYLFI